MSTGSEPQPCPDSPAGADGQPPPFPGSARSLLAQLCCLPDNEAVVIAFIFEPVLLFFLIVKKKALLVSVTLSKVGK